MDFGQSPQQNGMFDPSNFIDPSAIANPQLNGARGFPMNSLPTKRNSDGVALSLSRSQTPSQQPQFGFQQQQQQAFTHTPSPTMQNQNFVPAQMGQQRMQTSSPAQNPHAPQMSPMGFQGNAMAQGFNPNAGGQFPVQSVQLSQNLQERQLQAQRQYAMRLQQQAQQQQQQQQHQQQQQMGGAMGNLAAANMAAQQRHQSGQMPRAMQQHPGMQQNPMQAQQPQQAAQQNPQLALQHFTKNVGALMAQNQRPFNPSPTVAGRVINLQNLYRIVMQFKGYRYVTQSQGWPRVAQMMQIPPQQFPTAPEELRMVYEQNLGLYEQAYVQRQNQLKGAMPGQGPMGGAMGSQMSPTRPAVPGTPQNAAQQEYLQQLQRTKEAIQQQQQQQQRQSMPPTPQQPQFGATPAPQQSTPLQNNASLLDLNGRSTPQTDGNTRKSMSRQLEGTPVQGHEPTNTLATPEKPEPAAATAPAVVEAVEKRQPVIEQDDGTRVYQPAYRTQDTWGGLDFDSDNFKNMIEMIVNYKPNVPLLQEAGVIDIRALTMSLRSGLHAETRLALDTLSKITYDNNIQLDLGQCEDLVDVLVEFAEEQLEVLGNDNPEVTDILDLTPYEDVMHHCRAEAATLQDLPEVGTKEHTLDRTADRLLAITTIFRNLSFLEVNHASLVSPTVLRFLSNFIRLVGTRVLLLRSHINTFDFMKDLVTLFSNTSAKISLPSREDAYAVLHFLCAFAPVPRPGSPVRFTPFNPQIHRYLPSAVDSLAKLLARDDPNRTYYKQIFVNEATASPPYDLLTRAFALAISVVPDRSYIENKMYQSKETRPKESRMFEARIAESRKAYLMQGMLAADILASLAPGPETGVCRSWLESGDGWANGLLKFAMSLSATDAAIQPLPPQPTHRGQRPMEPDREGFQLIVHRALSTLKRLGDKSKGGDALVKSAQVNGTSNHDEEDDEDDDDMDMFNFNGTAWKVKADFLPRRETMLGALLTSNLDVRSLNQFCKIGYLDE